jgi:hypothetical protein
MTVTIRTAGVDVVDEALGRTRRTDPVLPGAGGPAGNARLTAWTGAVLFVLFIAELITVIDVHQLISWHLVIGTLLVPPALLKTGSTGWRIAGYYAGRRPYRDAGPPPMLLRILGPLVVAGTLGVLGTGLLLILLGPDVSRRTVLSALGQRLDWVGVHQATFVVWAVVTGLHTLARLVPAIRLTVAPAPAGTPVPGRVRRFWALVVTVGIAAVAAALVWSAAGSWRNQPDHRYGPPPGRHTTR